MTGRLSLLVIVVDLKNFEHLVDTARQVLKQQHDSHHARELAELFLAYAESAGRTSVTTPVSVPEPVLGEWIADRLRRTQLAAHEDRVAAGEGLAGLRGGPRTPESPSGPKADQLEVSDVTVQWSSTAPAGWEVCFRVGSDKATYQVRFGTGSMAEYRARTVARSLGEHESGPSTEDGTPVTKDVYIWWHTASAPLSWAVVFTMGCDKLSYEVKFGPRDEDRARADVVARLLERARYHAEEAQG